jgi:coenzyme F420 hydrogenase subunit beta
LNDYYRSDPLDIPPDRLSGAFISHDLCTRCGTCVGVCPEDALGLDRQNFPELVPGLCTGCGICRKVCPGAEVLFNDLSLRTFGQTTEDCGFDGHVTDTRIGHSTVPDIRDGGAGGGVITAILRDLLQSGTVDGCLVTRMKKDAPWQGEPFIARNCEELIGSQGSRYLVIPLNSMLKTLRREPGRVAVAALPCHVHGLRKTMQEIPEIGRKIAVVVGLFCGGALDGEVVTDLLRTRGLRKEELADFQFRGGEWPGSIRAVRKDGSIKNLHYSNYKEGAYNYFIGLYMPMRCQTCIDGSNEFSDLSVSDAWTKDKYGEYTFRNCSRILIRTPLGAETIDGCASRGALRLIDVVRDSNYLSQKLYARRKGLTAPLRVKRLAEKGVLVPRYDRSAPEATPGEKLAERGVSFLLVYAGRLHLRYYIIKFLTSPFAIPLIRLRLWLKSRKYLKRPDA